MLNMEFLFLSGFSMPPCTIQTREGGRTVSAHGNLDKTISFNSTENNTDSKTINPKNEHKKKIEEPYDIKKEIIEIKKKKKTIKDIIIEKTDGNAKETKIKFEKENMIFGIPVKTKGVVEVKCDSSNNNCNSIVVYDNAIAKILDFFSLIPKPLEYISLGKNLIAKLN